MHAHCYVLASATYVLHALSLLDHIMGMEIAANVKLSLTFPPPAEIPEIPATTSSQELHPSSATYNRMKFGITISLFFVCVLTAIPMQFCHGMLKLTFPIVNCKQSYHVRCCCNNSTSSLQARKGEY